ncbi:DUF4105 domain-containing protein [Acinetobacter sp. B51(2017)]|uniref:Lnb N-terminal periplasmic domain-containing protein n=1 Tax=Acinetobacter sp. B51(2017) TaxID=2060938 RepID=UPI000F088620|nr:DUF4105 domain-containing protein [Acinetobacter sp. B51(2017)]
MPTWIVLCYAIFLLATSLWVGLFIWVQQPVSAALSDLLISLWLIFAGLCFYLRTPTQSYLKALPALYMICFVLLVGVFFLLKPYNERNWQSNVERLVNYRFVDGQVEIHNVRNFIWHSKEHYTTQWETRRYALENINRVDLIISHFIQGPVAHAFISFGFKDGQHLAFSLEVRQEQHEGFSIVGGFFRQYELALVVGDENDVIYTRSNIRNEDVYLYPIQMQDTEMQMLFLEYLNKANRLNHQPRWYNTLVSNCTNILFDLMEHAMGNIPRDYRVVLPGLLPNYLYDHGQLDPSLSLAQWKQRAHVNPKTAHLSQGPDHAQSTFSQLIRQY